MNQDLIVGNIAGKIGRGLVAGLAGTAMITVSQIIEMRLNDRKPSTTPAEAASQVLGVHNVLEKADDSQKQNLSQVVHWGYGTSELITIAKYWHEWSDPYLIVCVPNNR